MTRILDGLLVAAVVGSGVVSGLLFIFSNTIMAALSRQGPDAGAAAMVAINAVILNPLFFLFFVGTVPLAVAAAGMALATGHDARFIIVGAAALYLLGVFLVTAAVNVPLNDRLAAVTPGTEEARALWSLYLQRWTRWNTIRTVAGLGATVLFALSLRGG